ncbi:MAG: V-type ATPase subunit [Nitrososphaerota archaeon]|nr:V-type ATPase subunit [Nitrososphaerales archaeon]MDW8045150.1 V-type ATPase subunit [Nitrososphaerota archaeon]
MSEYINVKCHALKTHLLPKSTILSLNMCEDLRSMVDMLLASDYSADISKLTRLDAHALERIFGKKLVERYTILKSNSIERYVILKVRHKGFMGSSLWRIYEEGLWGVEFPPEDLIGLIDVYARRLELQNIIRILRGKFSEILNEQIQETLFPLGKLSDIDFEVLLRVGKIDDVIEKLKGTIYGDLDEAYKLSRDHKSSLPMEMQLWATYYGYLINALSRIPKDEFENVKRIIGTEIDATNTFICTASVVYGYGKDFVKSIIVPFSFKLSVDTFKIAIQAESPEGLKKLLSPYAKIIDHIAKGDDMLAQVELYRYIRREAERQLLKDSTHAYVISYMLLCEVEFKDLTMMALGKQYGLKPEELKPYLISLS